MNSNLETITDLFSRQAPEYDQQVEWRKDAEILGCIKEFSGNISGIIVDLGTGTGLIAEQIHNKTNLTIGIDASREMLLRAKGRVGNVIQANAHQLPLLNNCVDCFTMRQILHYTDDKQVMHEISRILKQHGHIILADIVVENKSDFSWWKEVKGLVQPLRKRVYSMSAHLELLKEIGHSIERQRHIKIWRKDSWNIFLKHVSHNRACERKVYKLLKDAVAGSVNFPIKMNKEGIEYLQSWLITRSKSNI